MFPPDFMFTVAAYAAIVVAATELLKRILGLTGIYPVCFSVFFSFLFCLVSAPQSLISYITLSIYTALAANGLFKAVHKSRYL